MQTTTPHIPEETSPITRKLGYFIGPCFFLMTFVFGAPDGMELPAWHVCGLALWMACWWITEAMPLPVTSLLPIIMLPLFQITPLKDALAPFASPIIFLFLGGFMLSTAMEKWNLHLRIGLGIISKIGTGSKSILAGIMIATAFMGMWISNTATTIMMLPMAVSMAMLLTRRQDGSDTPIGNNLLAKAMILGVAYSAIIGGLGTFVGTPTNAILQGHMAKTYNHSFSLADWMSFGVPLLLFLLVCTWSLLSFFFLRKAYISPDVRGVVRNAYEKLGPMCREEKIVLFVFATVASLWIGGRFIGESLGLKIDDAVIAIIGAMLLFLVPIDKSMDTFALTWKDTARIPWGILIFFGGSLCVSDALTTTGVTSWLSTQLSVMHGFNIILIVLIMVILLIVVSEMMSNVATITAFLPILSAMAAAMNINPLIILVPATLAASCGFMLPGASAPNALAYGTGYLKIRDMIRTGLIMDSIAAIVITMCTFTLIAWAFGIDFTSVPEWAQNLGK
ncbi:MAG: SLC13 family permease [Alphaproteobacteria bacterium]